MSQLLDVSRAPWRRRMPLAHRAILALLVPALFSCADSPTATLVEEPAIGPPAQLRVIAGQAQSAPAGTTLDSELHVEVVDARGRAVAGAPINWVVVAGGGSVAAVSAGADDAGRARASWSLGTAAGEQAVTVKAGTASVVFNATAVAGPVARVAITPADTVRLTALGETAALSATPADAHGNAVTDAVAWRVLDTAVAAVSATGVVTALANGRTRVVASAGLAADTALIEVRQGVANVAIQSSDTVRLSSLGATAALTARITDARGNPVAVAPAWRAVDTGVATVDSTGLMTAVAPGSTRVIATAGTAADTVTVDVRQAVATIAIQSGDTLRFTALGATAALTARVLDARGNDIAQAVTWSVLDADVASITAAGLVTATGTGSTRVVASAGTAADTVAVDVRQVIATVTIEATDTLRFSTLGSVARLSARMRDAQGNSVPGSSAGWSTVDASVATVDTSGAVSPVANGTTLIIATAGAAADTLPVLVRQLPATLSLTPDTVTLTAGAAQQLHAVARDQSGAAVGDAAITWTSAAAAVAVVSDAGVVTAVAAGTARITATAGPASAHATVTVQAPPQAAAPITIATTQLAEGRERTTYAAQLAASGGTGSFTWSVSAGTLPPGVDLSATGAFAGTPTAAGTWAFTVQAADGVAAPAEQQLSLRICDAPLDLVAGESRVQQFPFGCGVILTGSTDAEYRVAVLARDYRSTGTTASTVGGGFVLRATQQGAPFAMSALRTPAEPVLDGPALDPHIEDLAAATEHAHHALRERELQQFGGAPAQRIGLPMASLRAQAAEPPKTRSFTVNSPNGVVTFNATLRSDGTNVIYYEDDGVAGTTERATDAQIKTLLDYYDAFGRPIIDGMFGGLAPIGTTYAWADGPRDTRDLDGNGKLIVVQLRKAYMLSNAAAYVYSCDRYPRPATAAAGQYTCSISNEGEITYFNKPDSDFYLGTLVHEVKHIASHGQAIFGGLGYQPSWIEEGTAEIAKERSSRLAAGFADDREAGLYDIYPGGGLTPATYGMATVHSRARSYLLAAPLNGITGNPGGNPNGSTYYGASWLFHRFLADNYAGGSEVDFFRSLQLARGVPGIEQVTGRSFAELQSEFAAAVSLEGTPGRTAAARRFRSYDFAAISRGFQSRPWPYTAGGQTAFRTADHTLDAIYSGIAYYDFNGSAGTQRLDLLGAGSMAVNVADNAALVITRVR